MRGGRGAGGDALVIDGLLLTASGLTVVYALVFLLAAARLRGLASPSALYAGLILVHFAVPAVLLAVGAGPGFVSGANRPFALEAICFAGVGLLALQAGEHSGTFFRSRRGSAPAAPAGWSGGRLLGVLILLGTVGWGVRAHVIASNAYFQIHRVVQGELEGPFYAVIRMLEQFPLQAMVLLAIRAFRPEPDGAAPWRRLLLLSMALELAYWLPSGRKEETIYVFLLPGLVWYLRRRRLPRPALMAAFAAFLAVLFPVVHLYRVAMELGGSPGGAVQTMVAAAQGIGASSGSVEISGTDIAINRLALLEPLSACVRLKDGTTWVEPPGQGYAAGVAGVVPRALWPDKPDLHYGTQFGEAAGMLSPGDDQTSVSVSFPGEAYLNFGWGGLLPLFLFGAAFGWIYRRGQAWGETGTLVYMILIPTLLFIGGTFALYFGGLLKTLPFFYVLGRWMEGPAGGPSAAREAGAASPVLEA